MSGGSPFSWTYEQFLSVHEAQLLASGVPHHLWPTLAEKLKTMDFDAGTSFQILVSEVERDEKSNEAFSDQENEKSVVTLKTLSRDDPANIFLIDHAWTFRLADARRQLYEIDGLKERLMAAFGISQDVDDQDHEDNAMQSEECATKNLMEKSEGLVENVSTSLDDSTAMHKSDSVLSFGAQNSLNGIGKKLSAIDRVLDAVWRHAQTYSLRVHNRELGDQCNQPVWYIPDEFGLCIPHSATPNTKIVPFFFAFDRTAFSLLFLLNDITDGENITRSFLPERILTKHQDWRAVLSLPWEPADFSENSVFYAPKNDDYFMSGRIADQLPTCDEGQGTKFARTLKDVVRICASERQLLDNLKRLKFVEVSDWSEADIVWMRDHFYDYRTLAVLNPGALVNQFPYEANLTVKDLCAAVIQQAHPFTQLNEFDLDLSPDWFQPTFNLDLELPQFVSYFQRREKKQLDNTWIVKPWNLGRGLDIMVTDRLNVAIRLAESGPKIACKYIDRPVLFRRPDNGCFVKFDLRYIVFVLGKSSFGEEKALVDTLVYNHFWPRFAIKHFSLDDLDDHLTHLTVHNYRENANELVYQMKCDVFIEHFQRQYPQIAWVDVQAKINDVIRTVIDTATREHPPRGLAPNPQSRAMYGFDIILKWKGDKKHSCAQLDTVDKSTYHAGVDSLQPVFIEANFMPDCERACEYYPEFADTVFETLFFDKIDLEKVTRI